MISESRGRAVVMIISESGGRAVAIAPSALGSKDHPAGPSKVPLRRIRQAIYPSRRIRRRNVEKKDPWRVSRHDNLPSSPSMASRNEVWKAEGFSTFSLGVLVRGHGIHTLMCFFSFYVFSLYRRRAGIVQPTTSIIKYSKVVNVMLMICPNGSSKIRLFLIY